MATRVRSTRFAPKDPTTPLGLLGGLAGSWKGHGFNLIARPDFHDSEDLYLQLNHTRDSIVFTPIGSPIPNRGFGQDDIELQGLTYLQKISDAAKDGALHIEPGIWATQPATFFPPDSAPAQGQLVARMATIPHGNAVLAQGIALPFTGTPVLVSGSQYNFSLFPSFNSTPFAVPPTAPGVAINAATSSEKLTAATVPAVPFPQYDLSIPPGPIVTGPIPPGPPAGPIYNPPALLNTRSPFDTDPPDPPFPNTPDNQALLNDPIALLQKDVQGLLDAGYTFDGVALNVATQTTVTFLTKPNIGGAGPTIAVNIPQLAGGGVSNIDFLLGQSVNVAGTPRPEENAQTALVYATFWLETVTNKKTGHSFEQLQYAQMVVLNFPVRHLLKQSPPVYVNLGWPHITVATLRKDFG